MKNGKIVLESYVQLILVLMPVFFLKGLVSEEVAFGKNWFLVSSAIVGLIIWSVGLFWIRRIRINLFLVGMMALWVWSLISFLFLPIGEKVKTWGSPFGMGTMTGLFIWTFLWMQINERKEKIWQLIAFTIGGVMAFVLSLFLGKGLVGSIMSQIVVFLLLIIEWTKIVMKFLSDVSGERSVEIKKYVILGLIGAMTLGIFYEGYMWMKQGRYDEKGLNVSSSWVISMESLKKYPLMGIGLGDYYRAFTMWRPASYNLSPYWNIGYGYSDMGLLELITNLGLGGLVVLFILGMIVAKLYRKEVMYGQIVLFLVLALLLPLNLMVWWVALYLAATNNIWTKEVLKVRKSSGLDGGLIAGAVIMVVIGGALLYGNFRMLFGEMHYKKAMTAVNKNKASESYDQIVRAIEYNPWMGGYRKVFSQINLMIARGVIGGQKIEDISPEDKKKITNFIQQAINEGKASVSLEPSNAEYWLSLSDVYKDVMGLADGAADWSFEALRQASVYDPVNPIIKLGVGGMLFSGGRYQDAEAVFQDAVELKPDLANSWYNWAYNAKKMGKLEDAVARMERAVQLVDKKVVENKKAIDELEVWKKELGGGKRAMTSVAPNKATPLPTKADKVKGITSEGVIPSVTQVVLPSVITPTVVQMPTE